MWSVMWRKCQKAKAGAAMTKLKVATCSLAGCFGCHMSILDLDERLFSLVDLVEFDRSPLTDTKQIGQCDVGIIGRGLQCRKRPRAAGVSRPLQDSDFNGACAITGGVPAMRSATLLSRNVWTNPISMEPGWSTHKSPATGNPITTQSGSSPA